jgi:hypothetical protein
LSCTALSEITDFVSCFLDSAGICFKVKSFFAEKNEKGFDDDEKFFLGD